MNVILPVQSEQWSHTGSVFKSDLRTFLLENDSKTWSLTLAFCSTFPLLEAMIDRGLFFRAVAELTGEESPLLMGVEGAGVVILG